MIKINYWKLTISILLCQVAGIIGSIFTVSSISTWYLTLNKPSFNPPSWIFGPVWITLYVLMGISLYIVWNKNLYTAQSKKAYITFGLQLMLNSMWTILFFGVKSPLLAFIEILLLWLTIIITMMYFYKISKPASILLIPYIVWVSFAAILNFYIFYMN